MSHFTVLVIGDDHEAALQPFHEFECTGTDDQYVQDIDETDEKRKEYAADNDRYGWELDDKLTRPLEAYLQHARDCAGVTFAVLHEGKWYERGEMGWWACVSGEKPEGEWEREFSNLVDGLPDDALLTVVDCHI